jgi:hypothetical protein
LLGFRERVGSTRLLEHLSAGRSISRWHYVEYYTQHELRWMAVIVPNGVLGFEGVVIEAVLASVAWGVDPDSHSRPGPKGMRKLIQLNSCQYRFIT